MSWTVTIITSQYIILVAFITFGLIWQGSATARVRGFISPGAPMLKMQMQKHL